MVEIQCTRHGPLERLPGMENAGTAAQFSVVPPRAKFALRCHSDATAAAGRAFGAALPVQPCRAVVTGDRAALWLGPDEWLLLAAENDGELIRGAIATALARTRHSLVDVSHRSCGFTVQGKHATTLLNHGCPLDLSHASFRVGMCTRTLFEKAEIILWRVAQHTYHVEIERSCAPYVWTMLIEVRGEFQ